MESLTQPKEDYLSRFPAFQTRDLDEARDILSRTWQDMKLEVPRNTQEFQLSLNLKPLRRLRLAYLDCPVEFTALHSSPMGVHSFDVVTGGTVGFSSGEDRMLADTRQATVASGEEPLNVQCNMGSHFLSAIIDHDAMQDLVSIWTGKTPRGPIQFAQSQSFRNPQAASFASMLQFFARELDRPGGLLEAPAALASMEDTLISSILFGLESNLGNEHFTPAPDAGSGMVRRLEDYLEAHAGDPIDIATVATETGYSTRSIYRAFRLHRDYSPTDFLRNVRMKAARKRLLEANPTDNVTSIALDCGFPHLGRFSQEYFRRFEEKPSETLCRSRR